MTWKRYMFLPELSCAGCKETDVVINVNPAYLGIMAAMGKESALDYALAGPMTKYQIFAFLWGPFTADVLSEVTKIRDNTLASYG